MSGRALLRMEALRCGFAAAGTVLGPVSFAVQRGELLVVAGPSGCGKSTLLRAIAGLEPHGGRIDWRRIDWPEIDRPEIDRPGHDRPGHDRTSGPGRIGVVFQEPRLMPWLDVRANVGFALPGTGRRERVDALLDLVGLRDAGALLPKQLSGGMAQRAALARGLAAGGPAGAPELLLLDEPFSALDPGNRARLGEHLRALQARLGVTMLMVTHDVAEAARLGDRILVLGGRPGRVAGTVAGNAGGDRRRVRDELEALLRVDA